MILTYLLSVFDKIKLINYILGLELNIFVLMSDVAHGPRFYFFLYRILSGHGFPASTY